MKTQATQALDLQRAWHEMTGGMLREDLAEDLVRSLRQLHGDQGEWYSHRTEAYWRNRIRYGLAMGWTEWSSFAAGWQELNDGQAPVVGMLLRPRMNQAGLELLQW